MSSVSVTEIASARRAGFFTFLLLGHMVLSSVAWVPEYIERLSVSFATWGLILGLAPMGAISAIVIASPLINRCGVTPLMRITAILAAGFLILLGFTNSAVLWAVANMVFNFLVSLTGVSVNTHAILLQKKAKKPILIGMHAGWSIGALAAAAGGGLATLSISLEAYLIITALVTVLGFEISARLLLSPANDGHHEEKMNGTGIRLTKIPARLWLLAFGLLCPVVGEIAVFEWSAVLARDTGADLELRVLPFAAFMFGMIIGRLSVNKLARRFGIHTIAVTGGVISSVAMGMGVAGAVVLSNTSALASILWLSTLWLLSGLASAPLGPTMISNASYIPGVMASQAFAVLTFVAQSISIPAKVLMGAIAEGVGVPASFVLPMVLLGIGAFIAHHTSERGGAQDLAIANPPTGPLPIISAERQD